MLQRAATRFYGTHVPAVDADGNEVAGIRLPADRGAARARIPAGTSTRRKPSELCDRDGSYVPFAKTKAEREASGDPRAFAGGALRLARDLCAQVRAAADALVRDRLLLPADADAYVQAAATSDRF